MEALQRRAQRHGRSMEEEVRLILRQGAKAEQRPPEGVGLGSQIAALFAASGLEEPFAEWQGHEASPVAFEA